MILAISRAARFAALPVNRNEVSMDAENIIFP